MWYRFEDYLESQGYTDETGEYISTGAHVRLRLLEFEFLSATPCGVVIRAFGKRRFINHSWTKRFACATQEDALESFIARKKRQRAIYLKRASNAEKAIELATLKRKATP